MARIANIDRGKHRRISATIDDEVENTRAVLVTVANAHGAPVQPTATAAAAASAVTIAGQAGSGIVKFWVPGDPAVLSFELNQGDVGILLGVYEIPAIPEHMGGYVAIMRTDDDGSGRAELLMVKSDAQPLVAQSIIIECGLDSIEILADWA